MNPAEGHLKFHQSLLDIKRGTASDFGASVQAQPVRAGALSMDLEKMAPSLVHDARSSGGTPSVALLLPHFAMVSVASIDVFLKPPGRPLFFSRKSHAVGQHLSSQSSSQCLY